MHGKYGDKIRTHFKWIHLCTQLVSNHFHTGGILTHEQFRTTTTLNTWTMLRHSAFLCTHTHRTLYTCAHILNGKTHTGCLLHVSIHATANGGAYNTPTEGERAKEWVMYVHKCIYRFSCIQKAIVNNCRASSDDRHWYWMVWTKSYRVHA